MWGRNKVAKDPERKTTRNRFGTVLGLDLSTDANDKPGSGLGNQTTDDWPAAVRTATIPLQRLSHGIEHARARLLTSLGLDAPLEAFSSRPGDCRDASDPLRLRVDTALIELTKKGDQLLEKQAKLFGDILTRIGEKSLCQAQANVNRTITRFETYLAQAEEMNSTLEATLKRFTQTIEETAQSQIRIIEERVARRSERIISQAEENPQSEMPQLQKRIEVFQAEIAAVSGSLEARPKAQLENIRPKAGNFSADLLSYVHAELEAWILELMQDKLQKISEEFSAGIARTFA